MEGLGVKDEPFRKTRELPDAVFGASMGVFSGPAESIELEFDARLARYARSRLWHESQKFDELADGRLAVRLHVSNDWALRSWLLGFGASVRVIRPKALTHAPRRV